MTTVLDSACLFTVLWHCAVRTDALGPWGSTARWYPKNTWAIIIVRSNCMFYKSLHIFSHQSNYIIYYHISYFFPMKYPHNISPVYHHIWWLNPHLVADCREMAQGSLYRAGLHSQEWSWEPRAVCYQQPYFTHGKGIKTYYHHIWRNKHPLTS